MKITSRYISFFMSVVGVVFLLFFLHYLNVLRPVESLVMWIFEPVQRVVYQASSGISSFYTDNKTKDQLAREVERLTNDLQASLQDKSYIAVLEEENAFLRNQLTVSERMKRKVLIGYVITRNTDENINTITIDQGFKDGVLVGAPVLVSDGIMVGKVMRTNEYSSVVLLVNDHTSQVAASIQNIDKTIGIVQGEYGLGVKMELIPQTEEINEGDIVITSGVEEYIPRGLVLGTIDTVIKSEESLFQEAVIRLPVDLTKIHMVSVLKPE